MDKPSGVGGPCPVCGGTKATECRSGIRPRMVRCVECTLLWQPADRGALAGDHPYDETYYRAWGEADRARVVKIRTFSAYLRLLEQHADKGRLLDVGCALGFLLEAAQERGWEPYGVEASVHAAQRARETFGEAVHMGVLENAPFEDGRFQAVTLTDVLEHLPDPLEALRRCAALLAPGGCVLVVTPRVGDLCERLLGRWWFQYKEEHLQLFTDRALDTVLRAAYLEPFFACTVRKTVSLQYLAGVFAAYRRPVLTPVLTGLSHALGPLSRAPFRTPTGEQLWIARKAEGGR